MRFKRFIAAPILVFALCFSSVPAFANDDVAVDGTQITSESEVLIPDLNLPTLTQLKKLRINSGFTDKAISTKYINLVSDTPRFHEQILQVQCTGLKVATSISVKVVNRSNGCIIKEATLQNGTGFNKTIPVDTTWDLYVKGDKDGLASLTIKD